MYILSVTKAMDSN